MRSEEQLLWMNETMFGGERTYTAARISLQLASIFQPKNTVEARMRQAILRGDAAELRLLFENTPRLATNDLAIVHRALLAMKHLSAGEARFLAQRYGVDFANKVRHVFLSKHGLQKLVRKFGSQEKVFCKCSALLTGCRLARGDSKR